jgi:hypothetical protein
LRAAKPPAFWLLLVFLDLDYFLAFVVTAARASMVWLAHFAAVAAGYHAGGFQGIMRAAPIAAA